MADSITFIHGRDFRYTQDSESDSRGLLGCDDKVSPALSNITTRVRISAENASEQQIPALVRWADDHSPVGCTVRAGSHLPLDIEIV